MHLLIGKSVDFCQKKSLLIKLPKLPTLQQACHNYYYIGLLINKL